MVTTRDQKKMLLIGGEMDNEENFDGILILSYDRLWKWRTKNNILNFGVQKHLAMIVLTGFAECGKK